jgi:hypothetical protein
VAAATRVELEQRPLPSLPLPLPLHPPYLDRTPPPAGGPRLTDVWLPTVMMNLCSASAAACLLLLQCCRPGPPEQVC